MTTKTLTALDAAIASFNGAEAAIDNGAQKRKVATRALYLAGAAHFKAEKAFTVDALMARMYSADNMPKGNALKSRKTEWNSVREAARVAGDRLASLYDDDTSRQMFIKLCTFIKNNPKASDDEIKAARKAKAPSMDTAGDVFDAIIKGLLTLAREHKAEAKPVAQELIRLKTHFDTERGKGRLPFRRELDKAGADKPASDLEALLAA